MSANPECRGCGITAADLPDGFHLEEAFDDGLCPGCQLAQLPVILCSDPACVSRRWTHSHCDGWPEHPDYKGR